MHGVKSSARGATNCCIRHGGGRRCAQDCCDAGASALGANNFFCIRHGGGRRCVVDGCEATARPRGAAGICRWHGDGRWCAAGGPQSAAGWYQGGPATFRICAWPWAGSLRVRVGVDLTVASSPALCTAVIAATGRTGGGGRTHHNCRCRPGGAQRQAALKAPDRCLHAWGGGVRLM